MTLDDADRNLIRTMINAELERQLMKKEDEDWHKRTLLLLLSVFCICAFVLGFFIGRIL